MQKLNELFSLEGTPAGRWESPQELQGLAVFLSPPASSFVNGETTYEDGGLSSVI
jgi:gluconate 5-dehydrogenase